MHQSERGFTLFELLLVLGLSSVIGTLGLSVNARMDRRQLLIAAQEVQSLIRESQQMAYGEQSVNIILFDYVVGRCSHIQNSKIIRRVYMPKNIHMRKTNFPSDKLYFSGHLPPNQGGTIVLDSKLYTLRVTVLPVTGRVKLYSAVRK